MSHLKLTFPRFPLSSLPFTSQVKIFITPTNPITSTPINMSTNESLSNKVGNATDGAVGNQTIVNEAATLASHTLEFGKLLTLLDCKGSS